MPQVLFFECEVEFFFPIRIEIKIEHVGERRSSGGENCDGSITHSSFDGIRISPSSF